MSGEFEWDRRKAARNLKKHGVSFGEAITVFADPLARIFDDPDHSGVEQREIIVGYSTRPRLWSPGLPNAAATSDSSWRAAPRRTRHDVMKKSRKAHVTRSKDLRAEYEFDYATSRGNRFAAGPAPTIAVVLEPDVARVFGTSRAVNRVLRSVINAAPGSAGAERKRKTG